MKAVKLRSPAKINLYLGVLGKRPDGFHELYTIFERIALFDKIVLSNRSDGKIKVTSNSRKVPKNSTNLAYRAADLLKKSFNVKDGVNIHIEKYIPVAAGLGGGSGNAAYVLKGLSKLWRLKLSDRQLQVFSERIGSDVPFFVKDYRFAIGKGRGERLKGISAIRPLWHVIVVPNKKLSTKTVYNALAWNKTASGSLRYNKSTTRSNLLTKNRVNANMLTHALRKQDLPLAQKSLFNALENSATRLCPEIKMVRNKMDSLGFKTSALSGSGPAVFGILKSRKEALVLSKKLQQENKQWQVFAVRTF